MIRKPLSNMPKISPTPKRILYLFLAINLIIGVFIAGDYGISLDHSQEVERAILAMRQYSLLKTGDPVAQYLDQGINQYYGTSMMSLFMLVENALRPLLHTPQYVIMHYMIFVSFLMGVAASFYLARRWMNEWVALVVAMLFCTQPLLFGHSFINPKDIPSMAIFIVAVAVGFWFADELQTNMPPSLNWMEELRLKAMQDWQTFSPKKKTRIRLWTLIWVVPLLWPLKLPHWLMKTVVSAAYNASPSSWLGTLFRQFATQTERVSLDDYLAFGNILVDQALLPIIILLTFISFILVISHLHNPFKSGWHNITSWLKETTTLRRIFWTSLVAGAIWGFAISVRATNITAGGIVGLYILLKQREQAMLPLVVYTLAAAATCYIAWPYLWYFGLQGFIDSLIAFSDYPYIGGRVWLRGIVNIEDLPATYLLETMAIQFTEPLVILSMIGVVLSVVLAIKKTLPQIDMFILSSWFFLPVLYSMIARPTMYNNFRQFFFITPPLFFFAGIAMDWIAQKVKRKAILAALAFLILAPNGYQIARLHPYEYVYYNQFVGGTEGAAGHYELDYWLMAYKETTLWLNEHASENARILLRNGGNIPSFFIRPDMTLRHIGFDSSPDLLEGFDYLMTTTNSRYEMTQIDLDALETVYKVYAGNTVIAEVKKISP